MLLCTPMLNHQDVSRLHLQNESSRFSAPLCPPSWSKALWLSPGLLQPPRARLCSPSQLLSTQQPGGSQENGSQLPAPPIQGPAPAVTPHFALASGHCSERHQQGLASAVPLLTRHLPWAFGQSQLLPESHTDPPFPAGAPHLVLPALLAAVSVTPSPAEAYTAYSPCALRLLFAVRPSPSGGDVGPVIRDLGSVCCRVPSTWNGAQHTVGGSQTGTGQTFRRQGWFRRQVCD